MIQIWLVPWDLYQSRNKLNDRVFEVRLPISLLNNSLQTSLDYPDPRIASKGCSADAVMPRLGLMDHVGNEFNTFALLQGFLLRGLATIMSRFGNC